MTFSLRIWRMKNINLLLAGFIAALVFSFNAVAADDWLIASKNESINSGQKLTMEVVKPEKTAWPQSLRLKLTGSGATESIELTPDDRAGADSGLRRTYSGRPMQQYVGVVHTELEDLSSNRVILLATNDDGTGPVQVSDSAESSEATAKSTRPTIVLAQPSDEPPLSANEPSYFVLGGDGHHGVDSRFQISFKYRPFAPEGSVAEFAPALSSLYFAYTQTTLWDIGGHSSPFRDTTYRPSLYYLWAGKGGSIAPDEWRFGLEHESNGQDGDDSRSLNIAFIRPSWYIDLANGKRLTLQPKFYQYLEKANNPDIQHYRGYADWQLRYGREDGLIVSGLYRQGTQGFASGQIDLSYPLSHRIFANTGTFVYLQLFSGYGETLLDYNKSSGTQIRAGISLSR